MLDVIIISPDTKLKQSCPYSLAEQLLRQGLAKIVKFYPYTLQLKGKPFDPRDPLASEKQNSPSPNINPPTVKRMKLFSEEVL